ncbi:conserved hypothetical protein [Chloroherpeton thalassium ATCC 35110]|uniref:Methyltransferase type 11 domain-containing protein n=1 Tax=Chloroherpeton thalassium (strain ATCC 35110 / GB-78) TaxID=517418 RepID=B3QXQ0_CHLT3|nr:methyltransferase domain-containing protein [Chloroherpeton thalassium]ACF14965.1 conserved hypothetical protein [Chloroherpeton thalassium ATCC 35110]
MLRKIANFFLPKDLMNGIKNYKVKKTENLKIQSSLDKIQKLIQQKEFLNLEIGSGPKKGSNGWITADMWDGADLYLNLLEPIPFPDNTIHKIYSSHLLEHFTIRELEKLLKECYRILVYDGVFSVCVPNARLYIESYCEPEKFDAERFCRYKPAFVYSSKIDYLNYIAYMDGQHKYMFDEENLPEILKRVGFKNVRLRDFDAKIDMESRQHQSIYAEATK